MTKTRVLLVDDHNIVRLGLMTLINDQPNMEVVGEAGTASEAVRAVERLRPDVVLMDIRMPGEGGIEAARAIATRFPQTKVVMLTSYADDELVVRSIRAGAVGYVLKQVDNAELLRAIEAAARGEALLDPATTARLLARVRETERQVEENAFRELSDREMDILTPLARGKTNAEIGTILGISESTVKKHLLEIFLQLGVETRSAATLRAIEVLSAPDVRKQSQA